MFLYDFINVLYVLIIMVTVSSILRINKLITIILFLHFVLIFLLNDYLFDVSYMPDQLSYLKMSSYIRNFHFNMIDEMAGRVLWSSVFFAFFPIPFLESVFSIAMINYLVYLLVFIFAYKKRLFNNKFGLYFYLIFPSLTLYSSIALRDFLIFTVMFISMYYLLSRKYIKGFLLTSVLILIKFQNFLIIVLSISISSIIKMKYNFKNLLIVFLVLSLTLIYGIDFFSLDKINYYARAFYNENIQDINYSFIPFSSYFDIIIKSLPNAFYFLMRPVPWEENSILQLVQFIENIFVLLTVIYILYKNTLYSLWKMEEIRLLNIFIIIGLVVYGLVIYNSGTAARYKFTFTAIYIIYSFYYIYQHKSNLSDKGTNK